MDEKSIESQSEIKSGNTTHPVNEPNSNSQITNWVMKNITHIIASIITLFVAILTAFGIISRNMEPIEETIKTLLVDSNDNQNKIYTDRTLVSLYKTEVAKELNTLSTSILNIQETKISTSTTTYPSATSTPVVLVPCPWPLSSSAITKEFQFTCPSKLVISSGDKNLEVDNGYTYIDLSNISELKFNSMISKIPHRSDLVTSNNYEVYFQFVELSTITEHADIFDFYKIRFYPVLRGEKENQYWECCGSETEDKLSKPKSETSSLPSFKVNMQLAWTISKTVNGIKVSVKFPEDKNELVINEAVPANHFSKPTIIIGYINPSNCESPNCSLQFTISDIVIN